MSLFFFGQLAAFVDIVPLGETSSTTRRRRVLSNEHRMSFPRCLSAIVLWLGRRQSLLDEILRMRKDGRKAFVFKVRFLFGAQSKALPKL